MFHVKHFCSIEGRILFHVKQKPVDLPVVSYKTAKYLMFHVKQL